MTSGTEIERLIVTLTGDISSYLAALDEAQKATRSAVSEVKDIASRLEQAVTGVFSNIAGKITEVVGVTGVLSAAFKGLQLAADFEKNQIAFGTMLGSMQAGASLVKDLQDFAAATPLEAGDLQAAAKTLLQFGVSGNQILPVLKQLGDVTGGNAENFNRLALAFGQMSATGRLMGQDLLQMINSGFNPLQEIARTTGKSMASLKEDMEKGKISVEMVQGAFASATAEGGMFAGLMERQSKSLGGLFSTLQDDINGFLRELGGAIAEGLNLHQVMKDLSAVAQGLTQSVRELRPEIMAALAVGKVLAEITAVVLALKGFVALSGSIAGGLQAIAAGFLAAKAGAATLLPTLLSLAPAIMAALPFVAIAAFGAAAATAFYQGSEGAKAFNDELERAQHLQEAIESKRAVRSQEKLGKLAGIGDREARAGAIGKEIESAKKELKGYESGVKQAADEVQRLSLYSNRWMPGTNELDAAKIELEAANRELKQQQGLIAELEKMKKAADPSSEIEKTKTDLDKLHDKLKDDVKYFGLSAEERLLAKAEALGFSAAVVEETRSLMDSEKQKKIDVEATKEETKAREHLAKQSEDLRQSLEDEIIALSAGGKLSRNNKMLNQLDRSDPLLSAYLGHLEEEKAMLEDVAKVTKSVQTPQEKFADEMDRLNTLFEADKLPLETYTRGVEKAKKELLGTSSAAKQAHADVTKFDAALAGSAEAESRRAAFRDMMARAGADLTLRMSGRARAPVGAPPPVSQSSGGSRDMNKTEDLLEEIRDILKHRRDIPGGQATMRLGLAGFR